MNRKNLLIWTVSIIACVVIFVIALVFIRNNNNDTLDGKIEYDIATQKPVTRASVNEEVSKDLITGETDFLMQTFYINTDEGEKLIEKSGPVPSEFIAKDRSQLQQYLDEYINDMPLSEYLDGLLSYEIVDFSNEKVILRKTYASDWTENDYYICDVNGEVVVYYADKNTVYEYTGIITEELSDEEQVRIKIGFFVSDEEELFSLLESYSS